MDDERTHISSPSMSNSTYPIVAFLSVCGARAWAIVLPALDATSPCPARVSILRRRLRGSRTANERGWVRASGVTVASRVRLETDSRLGYSTRLTAGHYDPVGSRAGLGDGHAHAMGERQRTATSGGRLRPRPTRTARQRHVSVSVSGQWRGRRRGHRHRHRTEHMVERRRVSMHVSLRISQQRAP